jgi:hypothetical protein
MEFTTASGGDKTTANHHRAVPVHGAIAVKRSSSRRFIRHWWRWLAAIILIGAVAWLVYGYVTTKNQLDKLSNPAVASQTETQQIVAEAGKLVDLPTGETPTLATVNDASKLKNQVFFADSQNGDKVLIYSKAGKAVLYRPSINKVIEFSSVNLNGNTSSSQ